MHATVSKSVEPVGQFFPLSGKDLGDPLVTML